MLLQWASKLVCRYCAEECQPLSFGRGVGQHAILASHHAHLRGVGEVLYHSLIRNSNIPGVVRKVRCCRFFPRRVLHRHGSIKNDCWTAGSIPICFNKHGTSARCARKADASIRKWSGACCSSAQTGKQIFRCQHRLGYFFRWRFLPWTTLGHGVSSKWLFIAIKPEAIGLYHIFIVREIIQLITVANNQVKLL